MELDVTPSLDPSKNYEDIILLCSNCCEQLQPIGARDPPEVPSYPAYELINGEEALKISAVLDRVFRLAHLRDLHEYEVEENVPLCLHCANILSQLDTFFQEFDRVRRFDSYLSAKIDKLDEVIQSGIAGLKFHSEGMNEDALAEAASDNEAIKSIKTEPEDSPEILVRTGPWVLLDRLRPEEIPEPNTVEPDSDPDYTNLDGGIQFEDADSTGEFIQEEKKDSQDKVANAIESPKKRVSKRNLSKRRLHPLRPESLPKTHNRTKETGKIKTAGRKSTGKQKQAKQSLKEGKKGPGPGRPREDEVREPKPYGRHEQFYRRKLVHPYPCQYCLQDFDLESDRVEHVKETHYDKHHPVICAPCGKLFSSEAGRKEHLPRCGIIPSKYRLPPFNCEECGKEFQSWKCLSAHKKMHTSERPYACDECDYKARHSSTLGNHKKSVHASIAEKIPCPECNVVLKNKATLESHTKAKHTERGRLKYEEHQRRRNELKRKIRRKKAEALTSFCSKCSIDFQTVPRFIRHQNEVHSTTKKWQCEQCGKGFNNCTIFKNHMQFVHTDERPYICDQCGVSFKNTKNLRTHMDRVHSEAGRARNNEYYRENHKRRRRLREELAKVNKNHELNAEEGLEEQGFESADVPLT